MSNQNLSRRQFLTTSAGAASALAAGERAQAAAGKPNIVILLSDQQHWQAMGCMDRFYDTPNLDALVSESTLFERSFCTTPQCSPSRSSFFTGFYPSKTGVMGNTGAAGGGDLKHKTFGARLQQAGYHTGYFGKWHLGDEPEGNAGWSEEWRQQRDAQVIERSVEFLKKKERHQKPFLLVASFLDPHDIYDFEPGKKDVSALRVPLSKSWHRETFEGKPPVQKEFMTADQGRKIWGQPQPVWEQYRDFYREKVKLYDNFAGGVIRALRENGLWENTIIVGSSDHGDMETNHKLIFKGPFLYEHMVRVPLIIRVPRSLGGVKPARIRDMDAVGVDVTPTLLDLAGLPPISTDGISWKPLLTGKGSQKKRDFVIGQYYSKQKWVNPIRMIRTAELKYNRYIEHGEELYDLQNDPEEIVNLARDPKFAAKKKDLQGELDRWIKANNDPFYSFQTTRLRG